MTHCHHPYRPRRRPDPRNPAADRAGKQRSAIAVKAAAVRASSMISTLPTDRNDDDLVIEKDGATVLIDPCRQGLPHGSEIDFVDDLIGQSFKDHNPNANPPAAAAPASRSDQSLRAAPPPPSCRMKIATWNVNSVKARLETLTRLAEGGQARRGVPAGNQMRGPGFPAPAFEELGYNVAHPRPEDLQRRGHPLEDAAARTSPRPARRRRG